MNSFQESFSANYIYEEKINAKGKAKGTYTYCGIWYSFCDSEGQRKVTKAKLGLAELMGIITFIAAGVQSAAFNSEKLFALFLGISVVAYIAEVSGVISFILSKSYITKDDYKWIDGRILYGSLIRAAILIIGLLTQIRNIESTVTDLMTVALYVITIVMSFAVYGIQKKVTFHTYRNENGQVGSEY